MRGEALPANLNRAARITCVVALLILPAGACGKTSSSKTNPPPTATPTVVSVSPSVGITAGGTQVEVRTAGFATSFLSVPPAVDFGGLPGSSITALSATSVTVFTPPSASAGSVDVTVTSADATETAVLLAGFTYTVILPPPPIVTGVMPNFGDTAGGGLVTVTGSEFDLVGPVGVTFGAASAASVSVIDAMTLTCMTPPGVPGPVIVTVTNPDAQQGSLVDGFTYMGVPAPPPVVAAVAPSSGDESGGDLVTVTGSDFDIVGPVGVTFGAANAASVSVIDATTLTCMTPPGVPGPVTVTVTNPDAQQGSLVDGFTYTTSPVPPPAVASMTPSSGDPLGGDFVILMGSGFDLLGPVTVTFGAASAGGVSVIDAATLTCLTPPGVPGSVTVTVTNPDAQQGSLIDGFTYTAAPPPPTVAAVAPSSGGTAGGDLVTVTGADFAIVGLVTVTFGITNAMSVRVLDSATLICLTPPGAPGPVTVTVTNPDAQLGSLVDGFTYTTADPAVIAMEDRVLDLINQERALVGKPALPHDPAVRLVARAHSEDMRDRNFFDHVNPDGDDPGARLTAAGIPFSTWAENIHWNLGAADPAQTAVDWWISSPVHQTNMLDLNSIGYTLTGIGCSTDGAGRWWFTALFVRP